MSINFNLLRLFFSCNFKFTWFVFPVAIIITENTAVRYCKFLSCAFSFCAVY